MSADRVSVRANDTLEALLRPRAVALVGASGTAGRLTARPLTFLQRHGFAGRILPINPGRDEIMGLPAYPDVASASGPIDHAYVLVNTEAAVDAVEACAAAGVRVVSVLADGFAEAGPEGQVRQDRLAAAAREGGLLLVGPNSTGVVATRNGFSATTNAAFAADALPAGRLAVLSQSGSVIGTMLSRGRAAGVGFSAFVSVGNEAAATVGTLGSLLLDDPDTDAFVLFLETVRDPDALAEFARTAAQQGKPVVAYMIGRSSEGQALSVSHTGALTGARAAVSAFFRDVGIREAEHFGTLLDAPSALRSRTPPGRPRAVTVVSTTGGGGAMVIDQIADRGVSVEGCSAESRRHLEAQSIPLGHGKLVDVTLAGARYETMKEVVRTLAADPATGLLLMVIGSSAEFNPELAVTPLVDAVAEAGADAAPVMAFPLPHAPESLMRLRAAGIPAFTSVETCAEAVAMALSAALPRPAHRPVLPGAAARLIEAAPAGVMDEVAAGAVFEALGVPRPAQTVLAPDEAVPKLTFAYPVVAKLVSPDLPHKTDAGAIRVGIEGPDALADAIAAMRASAEAHAPGHRLTGVLVQEMASGVAEVLVGMTRDPLVGPTLTVGLGGVMTEVFADALVRPAPVDAETAREMVVGLKGARLLTGFRGRPAADVDALGAAVAAIAALAMHPRVAEAEVNPLLAGRDGVMLLDALIRLD